MKYVVNWKSVIYINNCILIFHAFRFRPIFVIMFDYFCYHLVKIKINKAILMINLDNRKQA